MWWGEAEIARYLSALTEQDGTTYVEPFLRLQYIAVKVRDDAVKEA